MQNYFYSILKCGYEFPFNHMIKAKDKKDAIKKIFYDFIGCEDDEEYIESCSDCGFPSYEDLTIENMMDEMTSSEDILMVIVDCQKGKIIYEAE